MSQVKVKRLDHHGLVAGVIKDLGLIGEIDKFLGVNGEEEITSGEAIAGMIINGLGFTDRPLSLTPQFFEQLPLEELFHDGVEAQQFNHFKLGRVLDKLSIFGSEKLFSLLANRAVIQEGVNIEIQSLDTTSFSLTGEYDEGTDEHTINVTHGYSKDHRSDLKQIVTELIVSHDEGIPLVMKTFDGNSSDNEVFKERCKQLKKLWNDKDDIPVIIGDSKLYCQENADNLKSLFFITRIPETIKDAKELIKKCLSDDRKWLSYDEGNEYKCYKINHYELNQRWVVVKSAQAMKRCQHKIEIIIKKEYDKIKKELHHLQAKRFFNVKDAEAALEAISMNWRFHGVVGFEINEYKKYGEKGRPKFSTSESFIEYQISGEFSFDEDKKNDYVNEKSCFIVGSNCTNEYGPKTLIKNYKSQGHVERGFRFLKDSHFFASSFYVKKPSRIEGLTMVMCLSLLVYSIAQRRLRNILKKKRDAIPNQIGKPSKNPTMKWIFQIFHGINIVYIKDKGKWKKIFDGINDVRLKVIKYMGINTMKIYEIKEVQGCSM